MKHLNIKKADYHLDRMHAALDDMRRGLVMLAVSGSLLACLWFLS